MTVKLAELRLYCRIDQSEENDALLSSLGEEAEAYLRTTCGAEPETMTADELNVFKLAVKRMVLAAYDDPAGAQDPPGVRRLINGVKQFTV